MYKQFLPCMNMNESRRMFNFLIIQQKTLINFQELRFFAKQINYKHSNKSQY